MRPIRISSAITKRDEKSVNIYLLEIEKYPLLSPDREVYLVRRFRKGDKEALNEILQGNLRFVVSVAKKHLCPGILLADLISVGNLGLIEAVHRFDETKGFKFISYAVWWIRHEIFLELDKHLRAIRLPRNYLSAIAKVKKVMNELEQKLERFPTDEEISELSGLSVDNMMDVSISSQRIYSLDSFENDEEDSCLLDRLPDQGGLPADHLVTKGIEEELLHYLELIVPFREREIIKYFFGIGGYNLTVLTEIGVIMSLSKERTRQLKYHGICIMRNFFKHKKTVC